MKEILMGEGRRRRGKEGSRRFGKLIN